MNHVIPQEEAAKRLAELTRRAAAGETVYIEQDGVTVQLVLVEKKPEPKSFNREPGQFRDKIWMAPDFDETPEWFIDAYEGRDTEENGNS